MAPLENKRPSERAEQFLVEYLEREHRKPGDRLPSPRRIATELGVSESTVRSVVRRWLQHGKLCSRQGSGIFISKVAPSSQLVRIGANVQSESFGMAAWSHLVHISAIQAIMELGPKCLFKSLYSSAEEVDALSEKEIASRCRDLDGVIIFRHQIDGSKLVDFCKQHHKPYVCLNSPFDDCTSNYVASGNFVSFNRITRVLRDCGRKRFLILISPDPERSVSVRERLSGVINGIGTALSDSVELQIKVCPGVEPQHGQTVMRQILEEDRCHPDAILCAGDGLALGAFAALKEKRISVPEQASVIAGAGFDHRIQELEITTLMQPVMELGRSLVAMLNEMIERQQLEIPARILPVGIRTGKSTTPEESRKLEEAFS